MHLEQIIKCRIHVACADRVLLIAVCHGVDGSSASAWTNLSRVHHAQRDDESRSTPSGQALTAARHAGRHRGGFLKSPYWPDEISAVAGPHFIATETAASISSRSVPDDNLYVRCAHLTAWTQSSPARLAIGSPSRLRDRQARRQINRTAGKLKNITDRFTDSRGLPEIWALGSHVSDARPARRSRRPGRGRGTRHVH